MEDRRGAFLRWIDESECSQLLKNGVAKIEGTGRYRKVVLCSLSKERFDGPISVSAVNGGLQTTYEERFSQTPCPVTILKRYDERDGQFKKWDGNLTFAELKRGQMVSQATREAVKMMRRVRQRGSMEGAAA